MNSVAAEYSDDTEQACVSVDGVLRIYEAMDVINLAHWTLMEDVEIGGNAATGGGGGGGGMYKEKDTEYCISWCKGRFQPAQIAVGCGRENVVKVRVRACDGAL